MSGFISVKNFERFQHYKDRKPTWIKLYNDLLDDYDFGCLPDASKWLAVGLWLLASRHNNRVPNDPHWLARMIHATEPVDLSPLLRSGFIQPYEDASGSLAETEQGASLEVERETEGEIDTTTIIALRGRVANDREADADRIMRAANGGMKVNPALADFKPIGSGHPSRQVVIDWLADGVPADFAVLEVEGKARDYRPAAHGDQIHSMKYFDRAVRDAWRLDQTEVSDGADDRGAGAEARGAKPNKYDAVTEDGGTGLTVAEMRLRAG